MLIASSSNRHCGSYGIWTAGISEPTSGAPWNSLPPNARFDIGWVCRSTHPQSGAGAAGSVTRCEIDTERPVQEKVSLKVPAVPGAPAEPANVTPVVTCAPGAIVPSCTGSDAAGVVFRIAVVTCTAVAGRGVGFRTVIEPTYRPVRVLGERGHAGQLQNGERRLVSPSR